MASPEYASLLSRIEHLRRCFIVSKSDYSEYTRDDHTLKLAFQVLASAAIEGYVEQHCLKVAKSGVEKFKRGVPTSTGRALLAWSLARNVPQFIPIHENHFLQVDPGRIDIALDAYVKSVKNTHGISARDLGGLINPLGVQVAHVPPDLADKLQELSQKRDPAVHATVRTETDPNGEYLKVKNILQLLDQLEAGLEIALSTYPC